MERIVMKTENTSKENSNYEIIIFRRTDRKKSFFLYSDSNVHKKPETKEAIREWITSFIPVLVTTVNLSGKNAFASVTSVKHC